jgi:signal transduction histidine kinase/PAS domain-containing protein
MHATGMHAWAIDLRSHEVEIGDNSFGREGMPQRFPNTFGRARIFADDQAAFDDTVKRAIAGDGRFEIDHRFVHPETGEISWYRVRGAVERDDAGTAIRILGTSHEVTDQKLVERMQELSAQLVVGDEVAALYQRIVDVACAVVSSDAASLQLYSPECDELTLIAQRGLPDAALAEPQTRGRDFAAVSSDALISRSRIVVRDVLEHDRYPSLQRSGVRAAQVTPLITRGGQLVGMLATQWLTPHTPSSRELQHFDVVARQAADLIERSHATSALRESETRFRTLFESLDDGFYLAEPILDEAGACVDVLYLAENPAATRLTGQPLVGKRLRDVLPESSEQWFEACNRVVRTGVAERVEIAEKGRLIEGRIFQSEPNRLACVWRDITELRRRALRDTFQVQLSNALRPLADTLDIQAAALRLLGEQIGASRVVYAWITGRACEVVVNYRADGVRSVVGSHPIGDYMLATLTTGATMVVPDTSAVEGNLPIERAGHRRAQLFAHVTVPLVKGGRLISFMSVHSERPRAWTADEVALIELTAEHTWAAVERSMVEAELRAARDLLELRVAQRTNELARANGELRAEMAERQKLQRQLASAQEAERRRVARDLHDQTGQLLAGLSIAVRGIANVTDPEKLSDLRSIADELAAQVHALAVQLRPTVLDDLGLVPALRQLIDNWSQRVGVPVDFETSTLAERLPAEVETVLYRVVQEALTNTCKHSEATAVSVIASSLENVATAIVEDNGRGFDPATTPKDRLGVLGMRERVALAGGELVVESAPNRGTTVIARIPLR